MLIDTHAHLDFPDYAADLPEVLARATDVGVTRIITIGTSLEGSRRALELAEEHWNVFAAIGVHPNAADSVEANFADELRELAKSSRVVGIAETGLDYHRLPSTRGKDRPGPLLPALGNEDQSQIEAAIRDGAFKARQAEVFQSQLELAVELGLNVVIHERDAWDDTLAILGNYTGRLRAVFHCFGKGPEQAREVIAMGHLVSFTGIVTFKNAPLVHASATELPGESFMVETDCPFLAPAPHRGKRCEPAHTRLVAERVAALRGRTLEEIAEQTTATAEDFFRFP